MIGLLYLPMVLWGPLLALVTVSYSRRRRHVSPTRSTASFGAPPLTGGGVRGPAGGGQSSDWRVYSTIT